MKKLTRERVAPTISASVSWLIFGDHGFRLALFAEVSEEQQDAR